MNIFDILGSLLFTRKKIPYIDETFVLFLVQRWVSMYDPSLCVVLNETTNKHWAALTLPQEQYDYMYAVMWKMPFKRTNYIKKPKKNPTTKDEKDQHEEQRTIARNMNISVRELRLYHELID